MRTVIKLLVFFFCVHLFLTQVLSRVFAVFHANENATVVLKSDELGQYELKGTLKTDVLTLQQYVQLDDGANVYFDNDAIQYVSWFIEATPDNN